MKCSVPAGGCRCTTGDRAKKQGRGAKEANPGSFIQGPNRLLAFGLFYAVRLWCELDAVMGSGTALPLEASGLSLVVYTCGGCCAPRVLLLALLRC
jgi:hypothetical protein